MVQILRSTVISRNRVTLPRAVRDRLNAEPGMAPGTKVEFVLEDGFVTLRNLSVPDDDSSGADAESATEQEE